jgi:hypothetical protein
MPVDVSVSAVRRSFAETIRFEQWSVKGGSKPLYVHLHLGDHGGVKHPLWYAARFGYSTGAYGTRRASCCVTDAASVAKNAEQIIALLFRSEWR